VSRRAPHVGDEGAVVQVLRAAGLPERYVVESVDAGGATVWLAEFAAADLEAASRLPLERLTFAPMASGERSLELTDAVTWDAFPSYAEAVAARLGGRVVGRADGPDQRVWTVERDGALARYWITLEDLGSGPTVSVDPCDATAGATMDAVRETLLAVRGAAIPLDVTRDAAGRTRAVTGCAELDTFLSDDLGWGGEVDDPEEPMVQELVREIREYRDGRRAAVTNGGDLVCVRIDADGARLELMLPGAPRPGPVLATDAFVDVVLRWFDVVHPELAAKLRRMLHDPPAG
jgi:hypothetical protein